MYRKSLFRHLGDCIAQLRSRAIRIVQAFVSRKDPWVDAGIFVSFLLTWLFVGMLHIDDEGDSYNSFFIKRTPTFRIFFYNPYISDPHGEEHEYRTRLDDNGDWLPNTPELINYLRYCKARYGIDLPDPIQMRTQCRAASHTSK